MSVDEKLDELLRRTDGRRRNLECDLSWIEEISRTALAALSTDDDRSSALRAICRRAHLALSDIGGGAAQLPD